MAIALRTNCDAARLRTKACEARMPGRPGILAGPGGNLRWRQPDRGGGHGRGDAADRPRLGRQAERGRPRGAGRLQRARSEADPDRRAPAPPWPERSRAARYLPSTAWCDGV
jgi:hypothetical protein